MKHCPQCDTGYPDSQISCPTHGVPLNEIRDLRPGMVIRQSYRIVRKLGQGGMGAVYLAQHILMDEPRALKFLSSKLSRDQAFTGRFLREVRVLRQIRNRNVVDCGDLEAAEDGSLFFSMEFVDGPDLRGLMHDTAGPLPVPLALHIARQIAEGLGAAHAKGMVHRDIKPENILMARAAAAWLPKIADFGIVATKESSTAYTRTGGTLLTMAYAAPEQWRGTPAAELDGRTDLYALGGLLYEMLTGQTPFHAENYEGWSHQHQTTLPPLPSTLRPELANWQGLDALLLRLLAKDRNDRPKDVAELLGLLDAVRLVPPEGYRETEIDGPADKMSHKPAENDPKTARRWGIWLGLLAGGLILAALAVWFNSQRPTQTTDSTAQTAPVVQPQPENPQPEQIANPKPSNPETNAPQNQKPAHVEGYKPLAPTSEVPQQPKPAQVEDSNIHTPKPEIPQEPKPKPVEDTKPRIQGQDFAEIERNAVTLFGQKRHSEALSLFDQACTGGNGEACDNLGSMYEKGDGVSIDYPKAAALFSKSCDAAYPKGCNDIGEMLRNGKGVVVNNEEAVSLYTKACNGGSADGCSNLGTWYDGRNDHWNAFMYFSKACDAGSADGCHGLASLLQTESVGVDKSNPKFAQLQKQAYDRNTKACNLGSADGCVSLGTNYLWGVVVPKDKKKAMELLSRACSMGSEMGCYYVKKGK